MSIPYITHLFFLFIFFFAFHRERSPAFWKSDRAMTEIGYMARAIARYLLERARVVVAASSRRDISLIQTRFQPRSRVISRSRVIETRVSRLFNLFFFSVFLFSFFFLFSFLFFYF